jgi:hypothetical protein
LPAARQGCTEGWRFRCQKDEFLAVRLRMLKAAMFFSPETTTKFFMKDFACGKISGK